MKMTEKQSQLWKLADTELRKIGGLSAITRNPDRAIRERGNTEGTREWALLKSTGLASGILSDELCEKLINIIEGR